MIVMPLGALAATAVTGLGNIIGNSIAYQRQKDLARENYRAYISASKRVGATPAAIAQGLTGNGPAGVPAVSTSNNPMPDLGSTMNSAVAATAQQEQAQAALTNAETERQLALMRLRFEPQKYFADIKKSLSEAFENSKNAFLHGSMSKYYDELTKDVQQVRPWKIAGLRQSLINDMAMFDKILQDTATSKAQERNFNAGAYELSTRGDLNVANKELSYTNAYNQQLASFRTMWENSLLSYGIDPTKSFWENTARLMTTEPKLFKQRMTMFIGALNTIDGRIQENLGADYKQKIAAGYGLYKLNQIHQKNANARAYRFGVLGNTISSFIPFAGGSMPAVPESSGVDWWLKD